MITHIKLFIYFICLFIISIGLIPSSKAFAEELYSRSIYTSSALIIVLRHYDDQPLSIRRYGGFRQDHEIGPYIHPTYPEDRTRIRDQRYTGFVRVYKNRCTRCQPYTGFKKTYRGQRYTGFTNDYARAEYFSHRY